MDFNRGIADAKYLPEHGAILKPGPDVALLALDHIACSHHRMSRVPKPKVTGEWSVMADFAKEASEDLLSSPSKHVASTLCAA